MPLRSRSTRRAFIHDDCETGIYHVVSRVVDRRMAFGDDEKEKFTSIMRALAALCQVEVLTYCVMGNHFHILVRVPDRPEGFDLEFATVLELWRNAVGKERREQMEHFLDLWAKNGSERAIEEWRQGIVKRMFRLSEFMKLLKHRFSHWFNKRHKRTGTLWEARYTSVAVEDETRALRTMATYIDLNPVRAGLVQNPADYRWSGYADAMAGNVQAREGLERVVWQGRSGAERAVREGEGAAPAEGDGEKQRGAGVAGTDKVGTDKNGGSGRRDGGAPGDGAPGRRRLIEALVIYRSFMGHLGRELQHSDGTRKRRGLSDALAQRFEREGAQAVRTEALLCRVRHFTQGVLFGSRRFIDEWFTENKSRIYRGSAPETRQSGARPIGRATLPGMQTLRKFR